jgi:hypothetical protein
MDLEVQIRIHIGSAFLESLDLDPNPDFELYPKVFCHIKTLRVAASIGTEV